MDLRLSASVRLRRSEVIRDKIKHYPFQSCHGICRQQEKYRTLPQKRVVQTNLNPDRTLR